MLILVLTSNNGCWRSEAPRFVMCTPSREPVPVSLPWATQHSLCTPCPTLPWQTAAVCTSRSRETHARIASCCDHCCCDRCHTTDRAVCSIPPFACLLRPTTHTFPLTVALYIHLHTDIHLLGPARPSSSQLVYTQATRSHRPSAFQRDTNPDLPVRRGETRLRQAARGSPAPFLVPVLPSCSLQPTTALRLWLEPAVETRTHLRNTIHARRQTPHTIPPPLRHWLRMPLV